MGEASDEIKALRHALARLQKDKRTMGAKKKVILRIVKTINELAMEVVEYYLTAGEANMDLTEDAISAKIVRMQKLADLASSQMDREKATKVADATGSKV